MTGINTRISARDTVGATASMSHFVQDQSSGGSGQGSYTTITEMLNWNRLWTQELSSFLSGGANIKLPVGSDIPGQSEDLQVRPTAIARMTYSSYSEELRDAGLFDGLPSLAGSLSPGGIQAPGAYTASMAYRYTFVPRLRIFIWASAGACVRPKCKRGDHVQAHRLCGNELCT